MEKRNFFTFAVFSFILLFLLVPDIYSNDAYQVLDTGIAIGTTQRHEWHPWMKHNSVDDEFMVIFRTSGVISEDCEEGDEYDCSNSFQGVTAQRVSTAGELLGNPINVSPVEGPLDGVAWKSMARIAYNPSGNEFMACFTRNTNPENTGRDNLVDRVRINGNGTIVTNLGPLTPSTPYNASHPDIVFNSVEKEWLIVYNDKLFRPCTTPCNPLGVPFDNVGFILDEDGEIRLGPFVIGYSPIGSRFAPHGDYNPTDNTYLYTWEDWRYAPYPGAPWYFAPCEAYGSLMDADGVAVSDYASDIPMLDDYDTDDEGYQIAPVIIYNPDRNEFLMLDSDSKPSLEGVPGNGGGIMGRIFLADGTPKGPEFVAFDTKMHQGHPKAVYVQKTKQYFVVFEDRRDYIPPDPPPQYGGESDIYGVWLNAKGKPVGEEFPIFVGEGHQNMPAVAYSPVEERFLIVWRDENADGDFEPVGTGGGMAPEKKADVRGAIYGKEGGD